MHAKDPNLRIVSNKFQTANKSKLMEKLQDKYSQQWSAWKTFVIFFQSTGEDLITKNTKNNVNSLNIENSEINRYL